MDNWYPVLENLEDVKIPETVRIGLDSRDPEDCPTEEIVERIQELGGSPVFMRTDASSHKHQMEKASKLGSTDSEELEEAFERLLYHNMMAGGHGLPFKSIYLREWIELKSYFKAFDQTPIAPEIRLFIHDGGVLDYHVYWTKDAIKFYSDTEEPSDWESKWDELHNEAVGQAKFAKYQCRDVAESFRGQGFWSVDFALAESGDWYCIDMARGEVSWHPKIDDVDKPVTTLDDYEKIYDL